jgi:hypothetical protein
MGAGILPIAIHNGQLYFLFGKENKYADTPGYADFGGGSMNKSESLIHTAIREFTEETTGFWGTEEELTEYIQVTGMAHIDIPAAPNSRRTISYRTYILPVKYSPAFEKFYNNNHAFLESRLPEVVYKNSKIFEKAEVRWMTINDLYTSLLSKDIPEEHLEKYKSTRGKRDIHFRPYYMYVIQQLVDNYEELHKFISDRVGNSSNKLYTPDL